MKLILNDYKPNEIVKILREWTELSQEDFAKSVYRSKDSIKKIEIGQRNVYLHTFIEWAKIHNVKITMEKK